MGKLRKHWDREEEGEGQHSVAVQHLQVNSAAARSYVLTTPGCTHCTLYSVYRAEPDTGAPPLSVAVINLSVLVFGKISPRLLTSIRSIGYRC